MSVYRSTHTREVLGECTQEWSSNPPEPIEAVLQFRKKLGSLADTYTTYLSTAITAGGYVRDRTLTRPEVAEQNTITAYLYADYLGDCGLLNQKRSVDAVALGNIPGWRQSDYMHFWLPVMTRPDLDTSNIRTLDSSIKNFESTHDMEAFNDSTAPQSLRRPIYQELGCAYLDATYHMQSNPVRRTVQLIDGEMSLGGDVEGLVSCGSRININVPAYHGTPLEFASSIRNQQLRNRLTYLAELGATFADYSPEPGVSLQDLVKQHF